MKILKTFTEDIDLESVAIGLGFVEEKRNRAVATSGDKPYTAIRWNRVNNYLKEIGCEPFDTSGERKLIPEWAFYMLAMKAKNEAAKKFQMKVAKDILPSIRKNGFYVSDNLSPNQVARLHYTVKEQQKKLRMLETIEKQNDKLIEALAQKTSAYRSWYYGC